MGTIDNDNNSNTFDCKNNLLHQQQDNNEKLLG